jgi:septal ring-binding cell division protein DamX
MRFEIGPGGGFVILVGLLGLSAGVFFLGMISGREIAQSEQGQSQLASVYPMPAGAPPAAPPQAAAPAAPAAAATAKPVAQTAAASSSENIPPAVQHKPPIKHAPPPRPTLARAPLVHPPAPAAEESDTNSSAPSGSSASSDEADTSAGEGTASAPLPHAATRGKGYNIVIDAAMDRGAANRMASRLLGLGYTSHIVPTLINGQTWYRVQVGPYPSADDARAAQAQLRAAYTARYVNRAGAASTGSSTDGDTSDSGAADTESSDDSGGGASAPSD